MRYDTAERVSLSLFASRDRMNARAACTPLTTLTSSSSSSIGIAPSAPEGHFESFALLPILFEKKKGKKKKNGATMRWYRQDSNDSWLVIGVEREILSLPSKVIRESQKHLQGLALPRLVASYCLRRSISCLLVAKLWILEEGEHCWCLVVWCHFSKNNNYTTTQK